MFFIQLEKKNQLRRGSTGRVLDMAMRKERFALIQVFAWLLGENIGKSMNYPISLPESQVHFKDERFDDVIPGVIFYKLPHKVISFEHT